MGSQETQKQMISPPLNGKVKPLEHVPGPMFAEKMMRDGLAIEPTDGEVVSPVNGEIIVAFPTKHAVGLRTDSGVELLIHVGIDTVDLNGEGFEFHVEQGQHVKVGD